MNIQTLWKKTITKLASKLSQVAIETWIVPLEIESFDDGVLTLLAESEFNRDQVAKRYIDPISEAAREVFACPVRVKIRVGSLLNNLNNKYKFTGEIVDLTSFNGGSLELENKNLNNLKPKNAKNRSGVSRRELWDDGCWRKALDWGFDEAMLQYCIAEYGSYVIKGQINRIHQIPEGYFRPKYGPINQQRGRLLNKEMQKLRGQGGTVSYA
jgi:DnaA N-terminal domain